MHELSSDILPLEVRSQLRRALVQGLPRLLDEALRERLSKLFHAEARFSERGGSREGGIACSEELRAMSPLFNRKPDPTT